MSKPTPILWIDQQHCSPWVLSVWVALKEKGIAFESRSIELREPGHETESFAREFPLGKIPALEHGDLRVAESQAIIEYLEETYSPPWHPPLFPESVAARAKERELMSWIRSDLFEIRRCFPFEGLFEDIERPPVSPEAKVEIQHLLSVARARARTALDRALTMADYDLCFMLERLIHYNYPLPANDEAIRYAELIWRRPSVQSWQKSRPAAKT